MRQLSSDLREFIHLLNTKSVKYVIVGAWALAFHGRPRYTGDIEPFVRGRHRSFVFAPPWSAIPVLKANPTLS
jgi:hypothetical protein